MDEYSTRILLQSILGQVITVSPSKYGLKKGISPRNWCWSLPPGSAVLGSTASVFNGCLSGIHLTRVTSLLLSGPGEGVGYGGDPVTNSCSWCESGKSTFLNKFIVLVTSSHLCVSQACAAIFVKCISVGDTVPGVAVGAGLSGHKKSQVYELTLPTG